MYNLVLSGGIDLPLILTDLFVLFFFALVLHLRREDRREGYPLEEEMSGRLESTSGLFFTATTKTFILPHGEGTLTVPNANRESQELKARRMSRTAGSPLEPVGDPLQAGIGPGAYAHRAKFPDLLMDGETKIAPLRVCPGYSLDGPDPIGMTAVGADRVAAGVVSDAWIDRTEFLVRYLEVKLAGAEGRTVLVPMPMVDIDKSSKKVRVKAVLGAQFAGAPSLDSPNQITFDEEERVAAYFGGGLRYATPSRLEPYL